MCFLFYDVSAFATLPPSSGRKIWQGWTVTNSLDSVNSWLKMAAFSLALTAWLTAPRLEEPPAAFFGESEMLKYDWVQGQGQSQMCLHWLANSCSQGVHWTFWLSNYKMLFVQFPEFDFWFRVEDTYPALLGHAVKQLAPFPLVCSSKAGFMLWFLSKPALPRVSLLDKRCAISSAPVSFEKLF